MCLISSLSKQNLERMEIMQKRCSKPNKIKVVVQVDTSLDKTLSKENIIFGFKVTRIQHLNPSTTNDKLLFGEVYKTTKFNGLNKIKPQFK